MKILTVMLILVALLFTGCALFDTLDEAAFEREQVIGPGGELEPAWESPDGAVVPESTVPLGDDGTPAKGYAPRYNPQVRPSAEQAITSVTGLIPIWGEAIGAGLISALGIYGTIRHRRKKKAQFAG